MLADDGGLLSISGIERAFSAAETLRNPRVTEMVKESIQVQRLSAWASGTLGLLDRCLVPLIPTPLVINQLSNCYTRSYRCKALANPSKERPHTIPFADELLTSPMSRGWWTQVACVTYFLLIGLGLYGFVYLPSSDNTSEQLQSAASTHSFEGHSTRMLDFETVPVVGQLLNYGLAAFFPALEGWDSALRVTTLYLTISKLAIFASWMVESSRLRNRYMPARFMAVFGCLSNFSVIALGACIYYMLDTICTHDPASFWPTSTHVPEAEASAILPALLIGVLGPTLLMYAPFMGSEGRQWLEVIWTFFPLFLHFLHQAFTRHYRKRTIGTQAISTTLELPDVRSASSLRTLYTSVFVICAFLHIGVVSYVLHPCNDMSLQAVFGTTYPAVHLVQGIKNMFVWDLWIMLLAALLWSFISTLDLRRAGLTDISITTVTLFLLVGSVLLGPAATIAACCAWRERVLCFQRGQSIHNAELTEREGTRRVFENVISVLRRYTK